MLNLSEAGGRKLEKWGYQQIPYIQNDTIHLNQCNRGIDTVYQNTYIESLIS